MRKLKLFVLLPLSFALFGCNETKTYNWKYDAEIIVAFGDNTYLTFNSPECYALLDNGIVVKTIKRTWELNNFYYEITYKGGYLL